MDVQLWLFLVNGSAYTPTLMRKSTLSPVRLQRGGWFSGQTSFTEKWTHCWLLLSWCVYLRFFVQLKQSLMCTEIYIYIYIDIYIIYQQQAEASVRSKGNHCCMRKPDLSYRSMHFTGTCVHVSLVHVSLVHVCVCVCVCVLALNKDGMCREEVHREREE